MLEKILVKEVVAPILIILFSVLFYLIITKIIKKFFNIKSKRLNERKKKTREMILLK
jgi:lipopolysaccharide export LptBFGC system permease protein LptF